MQFHISFSLVLVYLFVGMFPFRCFLMAFQRIDAEQGQQKIGVAVFCLFCVLLLFVFLSFLAV